MHAQHNISPDGYKKKNTTQLMRRASERPLTTSSPLKRMKPTTTRKPGVCRLIHNEWRRELCLFAECNFLYEVGCLLYVHLKTTVITVCTSKRSAFVFAPIFIS